MQECGFHPWVKKDPLEKEMATHSSILAWRIPWTEEPGGLQSTGSQSQTQLSTHPRGGHHKVWCEKSTVCVMCREIESFCDQS